jgi:integrase
VDQFRYYLEGRYAKGAKSRWIYFDRLLLQDMKRYLETERQWLINQTSRKDPSLFLRTDQRYAGTGIGEEQASRVFRKRADAAGLNALLTFHDLRHTFATELFHAELTAPNGRETRSESAALIVVAQRLGHAIGRDGHAPAVTTKYIRMRMQMLEMEEMVDEQA